MSAKPNIHTESQTCLLGRPTARSPQEGQQTMHLIFSFPDGRRIEGILLAVSSDQIRIAITGEEDAVEFRRLDGYWNTEDGVRIELESAITDGGREVARCRH